MKKLAEWADVPAKKLAPKAEWDALAAWWEHYHNNTGPFAPAPKPAPKRKARKKATS